MKPFTDQLALTITAAIEPGRRAELQGLLAEIDADVEANARLPFKQLAGVHFARFVVLPAFTDGQNNATPDQFVYSSNYDGSLDEHLREVTAPATLPGFHRVFSCCRGFSATLPPAEAVRQFIRTNQRNVHTFYRGHRGLAVRQIHREQAMYNAIQAYLNQAPVDALPPEVIKQNVEQYVRQAIPAWQPAAAVRLPYASPRTVAVGAAGLVVGTLLLTGGLLSWWVPAVLVLLLGLVIGYLRYLETRAVPLADTDRNFQKVTRLASQEDKVVQNQLTHVVPLQPGSFRRNLQRLALWALNGLATYTFNRGRLGDIATIHFARWLLIDRGRRLAFFSNFDGSWENYLGDFVDRAAVGLTLAWSNTIEFPRTKFLVFNGATDEERFKNWTRKYQVPTQVWYSAYPALTVKNILQNHAIALGIGRPMNARQIREWLMLL